VRSQTLAFHPARSLIARALVPLAAALSVVAVAPGPAAEAATGSGPVDVLYAGSLVDIMMNQVGPAFDKATGYNFVGFSGGSSELASDIKGKLRPVDVFVSASASVDSTLMGKANGDWVSSYKDVGRTYLEIGYNPKSKFAAQLKSKPWYDVIGEPGFRIGRTDPATDPKGVLADQALNGAAVKYHQPALKTEASETSDVFPEESLVGRLQSGELDAGFFYAVEAQAAHIPTVPLTGYPLYATYTVALVNHAPHPAGAASFIAFLTGPKGKQILSKDGLTVNN
jgi:molybdate/tungstate transport system substrate-binding protein